ncbi:MAG TPA: amidohydrolase family protein [Phycisphaerales bacterium]|nr:amidohydrolase family protein [Phycisphaerales bacterium]
MHTRPLQSLAFLFLGALGVLCGETALAQDLTPRAKPQGKPVLITNATVHPIAEKAIENGFVLFAEGKISGLGMVGAMDLSKVQGSDGWRTIDAKGMHVYPGLIGAATQLGLEEMQSIRSSTDHTETGSVTPEVRAATAINPDSTLLPVTRSAGELIAGVFPQGGAIPGRASVIRLDGWTVADMTIRENAGLVINWPMTRIITAWWMNKSEDEQRKDNDRAIRIIEDMVSGAKAYAAASFAGEQRAADIRYEAMTGIFGYRQEGAGGRTGPDADRRLPVFIHAMDYDQIQQAVTFCVKHGLKCVIVGGRDAPMCADLLTRHNASVIVSGTYKFPKRDDSPYDEAFTLPARLEAAGVKWCLASGEETAHERNLAPAAGMAVAYGLDHEAGLRSITLSAAEILGIADTYGSLAIDKSATLIIADGDILDARTHVTAAFLDGREVDLRDKQKMLDERYREKYKLKGGPETVKP